MFGWVLGRLAITRAFGDFECKNIEIEDKETGEKEYKSFITCEPEIREITISPEEDEFIIIASDGLYDWATSADAIKMVRSKLSTQNLYEQDPQRVAYEVVEEIIGQCVGSDNITLLIACLNRGISE